jgi:2,4-dienoyl-CoA reductase-like NADH-dependent reductase (Old Yellow Enzyme family)
MTDLWSPVVLGRLDLKNRLVMAPMTRGRALPDGTPSESAARYYAQRAAFGLIVTEGTQPSDEGQGYLLTPGSYTPAHIAGWRRVAEAVHAEGGRIVVQLMHVGRMGHPSNSPDRHQPVAPSAVAPPTKKMFTLDGLKEMPTPRALDIPGIRGAIDDYRRAAAAAVEAGLDGVELHGANGYLIQQFLSANANLRTDDYGGSIDRRVRFAVEVMTAVAREIGADRTGLRISPGSSFNDIDEGDAAPLYERLLAELAPLGLAYLHVLHVGDEALVAKLRAWWKTGLIVNRPGRARDDIARDVAAGLAEAASVGTFALANPDLVARLRHGAELNTPDPDTFFVGGDRGYTDYPRLAL